MPKSVQNVIPIYTIWEDGIFLVGRNKYAKTFKFEDINYAVASREDKEAMRFKCFWRFMTTTRYVSALICSKQPNTRSAGI